MKKTSSKIQWGKSRLRGKTMEEFRLVFAHYMATCPSRRLPRVDICPVLIDFRVHPAIVSTNI
jgi:hypothetical protein